ncbi:MAG: BREX-3 system P-loop-containing protein BrxF [bacterium]|nr:BREX-3 system P-loop-containing protein BrxF [bacterium]
MDFNSLISKAESSYYKLIVVVGKSESGKTALLRQFAEEFQFPLVNLGLELSRRLLNLTVKQRKLKAAEIIEEILEERGDLRLAVDNTEVIFDPDLKLSPFGLLKNISRNRMLVWTWNGEMDGNHIIYSYAGHPEHHRIPSNEFITIST